MTGGMTWAVQTPKAFLPHHDTVALMKPFIGGKTVRHGQVEHLALHSKLFDPKKIGFVWSIDWQIMGLSKSNLLLASIADVIEALGIIVVQRRASCLPVDAAWKDRTVRGRAGPLLRTVAILL